MNRFNIKTFYDNEQISMIEIILGKADPMHLIEIGCPSNEYRPEAELIYKGIKDSEKGFVLWECIQKVFIKKD